MKLLKLVLVAAALSGGAANAQSYMHQRLGNFDFYNGPGYQGFGQELGPFYFYHDNYSSGFGQHLGNFDFYNYTPYNRYSPYFGYDDDDDE